MVYNKLYDNNIYVYIHCYIYIYTHNVIKVSIILLLGEPCIFIQVFLYFLIWNKIA